MSNKALMRIPEDALAAKGLTFDKVAQVLKEALEFPNHIVRLAALKELRAWRRELRAELEMIGDDQRQAAAAGDSEKSQQLQQRLKGINPDQLESLKQDYING